MKPIIYLLTFLGIIFQGDLSAQDLSTTDVLNKSYDKQLGNNSIAEMKMTIVRPEWKREISLKNWSYGKEYYLIYITQPARDRGQVFLKRDKNMWNWIPNINRMMKIPPSMMSGSWMGSDFSNNDLVRERTLIEDYEASFLPEESKSGFDCYQLELIPKPQAPVVWSKIVVWIDKEHFNTVQADYYNEDNEVVSRQETSDYKDFDGRYLPGRLTMIPLKKEGEMTIIETVSIDFDVKSVNKNMFSIQNMKRIRP